MSLHYYKLLLSTEGSSISGYNGYFKNARVSQTLLCYLLKIAEVNGIQSMSFASKLCITPPPKKPHLPPPPTHTQKETDKRCYLLKIATDII